MSLAFSETPKTGFVATRPILYCLLFLVILKDYSIRFKTINMELSILYFKGMRVKISKKKNDVFLSLKIVLS